MIAPAAAAPTSGVFYPYIRVSKQDQANSGLSLAAQEHQAEAYFKYLNSKREAMDLPPLAWGGMYADKAVSAFKYNFVLRPSGRALHQRLRKGDHVAFTKLDRGFRDTKDMISMTNLWTAQGVTTHFLDINVDMSTSTGQLFATIVAAMAQWESQRKSERNKDVMEELRRRGKILSGSVPVGLKPGPHGRFVENPDDICMLRMVLAMRGPEPKRPLCTYDEIRSLLRHLKVKAPVERHRNHKPGTEGWSGEALIGYYGESLLRRLTPSLEYLDRYPQRVSKIGRKDREVYERVKAVELGSREALLAQISTC